MKKISSIALVVILLAGCSSVKTALPTMGSVMPTAIPATMVPLSFSATPLTSFTAKPTITKTPIQASSTPVILSVPPSEPYPHRVSAVYSQGPYIFNDVSVFGNYIVGRIVSADLDNDGDLDLIVASEENYSLIQVYENLGDAVFRNSGAVFPFRSSDPRHWNFGIAVADFNQDGLLDIATADAWAGLNIYFGQGRLKFATAQNYTYSGMVEVKGIAAVDLNHDGWTDIILGDHNGLGGVRILFNDGTGHLVDSEHSINPGDITWDVFAGDFNQDGAPDFVSINRYAEQPSRLHMNNGSGIFTQTVDIPNALDDSYDIKCFPFEDHSYCFIANSEGNTKMLDRFVVFDKTGLPIVNKGFGQAGQETKALCLVDLDFNHIPELVTGNYNWGSYVYSFQKGKDGLLDFGKRMPLFSIDTTSYLDCQDFNKDGLTDILVGIADPNGGFRDYHLLLQQPPGSIKVVPVITSTPTASRTPTISTTPLTSALPNPLFVRSAASRAFQTSNTERVILGDLNGDGALDLVEGNGGELAQSLKIFFNDGKGNFIANTQEFPPVQLRDIALGDIDNDGDLDMVTCGTVEGTMIWRNDGQGNFIAGQVFVDPPDVREVRLVDLDGDGDLDLLNASIGTRVLFNDGKGNFTDSGQVLGDQLTRSLAVGDIDNDGDMDFVQGNAIFQDWPTASRVFLNDENGQFKDSGQVLGPRDTIDTRLVDLNADGFLDLVTGNSHDSPNDVYFNDQHGKFTFQYSFREPGKETKGMAVGDVDNDGDFDVVTGDWNGGSRIFINDSIGHLALQGQPLGPDRTNYVALGDVDGDLNPDILVAVKQNPDVLYHNQIGLLRKNTLPSPPTDLLATMTQTGVQFSWQAGQDQETPAVLLSYNLRVGTTPEGNEILSSVHGTGPGNMGQALSTIIKHLGNGHYYWSVQSVDSAFEQSAWSSEQEIEVQ